MSKYIEHIVQDGKISKMGHGVRYRSGVDALSALTVVNETFAFVISLTGNAQRHRNDVQWPCK